VITENIEGRGPCYLDLRHVPDEDLEVLYEVSPSVKRAFDEFKIDPHKHLLELGPFVVIGTLSSSGPHIDLNGATNVPGLYAVGYGTSCPHLMSGISGSGISSFSSVGGYRAGEHAATTTQELSLPSLHQKQVDASVKAYFKPMRKLRMVRPSDIWLEIANITCDPAFALFKTDARIRKVIGELEELRAEKMPKVYAPDFHELEKVSEVRAYLDMAILACYAMLERTESRGELFRADYPYMDNDNWIKWLLVHKAEDSEKPVFRKVSPPFERWPIKPPGGRIPSPYTVPKEYEAGGTS